MVKDLTGFLTNIKLLAKDCNFCNDACQSSNISDRIVGGVKDNELRKQLLSVKDLNEAKTIEICRAFETAENDLKSLKITKAEKFEIDRVNQFQSNRPNHRDKQTNNYSLLSW